MLLRANANHDCRARLVLHPLTDRQNARFLVILDHERPNLPQTTAYQAEN
ncbi:Uncharacterised protein [Vibrio cholerae]|nr:Uncharacterised protein [Vibrio cholerae]